MLSVFQIIRIEILDAQEVTDENNKATLPLFVSLSVLFACNHLRLVSGVAGYSRLRSWSRIFRWRRVADNASVLARNPAAMTILIQPNFQARGFLMLIQRDITQNNVPGSGRSKPLSKDVAPLPSFLPHTTSALSTINGLGVSVCFLTMELLPIIRMIFMRGWSCRWHLTCVSEPESECRFYRINDQFSVGAGANLVYARLNLIVTRALFLKTSLRSGLNKTDQYDRWNICICWNVGALYELNENNRFSIAYRSEVDLDFDDGDFTDTRAASCKVVLRQQQAV